MLGIAVIPLVIGLVISAGAPTWAATGAQSPKSPPQPDAQSSSAESTYRNPPSPICSTPTSTAANVNTDCEPGVGVHNETAIAVNHKNPLNIIGSANDYQLKVSSGGSILTTVFSRAHVSFDGGKTWTTYPIRFNGYQDTGDPSIAFDARGTAYLTTLANGGNNTPDVVVASSSDGGRTWSTPVVVAAGKGSFSGDVVVCFYDTYLYAPDGSTNLGRNTHMAVRVNPQTGALADGPHRIGLAYDGIVEGDFPVSIDGRQTLHDSEFRLLMQGNTAADPTNRRHFAVVWFDDRNASLPVDPDPYKAVTNSDIIVSQSFDAGVTWTAPSAIAQPGDQFMPWAAYDAAGRLRVGYFDRSYDAANHKYGYTLATESTPGSLTLSRQQVTTALSDPTRDDRWSAVTVNPSFPFATRFIGDYSGIATTPDHVAAYWTDMRETACLNRCGAGENTYFGVRSLATSRPAETRRRRDRRRRSHCVIRAASLSSTPLTGRGHACCAQPANTPLRHNGRTSVLRFFRRPLDRPTLEALARGLAQPAGGASAREVTFMPWGGGYNRAAPDAAAFPYRTSSSSSSARQTQRIPCSRRLRGIVRPASPAACEPPRRPACTRLPGRVRTDHGRRCVGDPSGGVNAEEPGVALTVLRIRCRSLSAGRSRAPAAGSTPARRHQRSHRRGSGWRRTARRCCGRRPPGRSSRR